MSRSNCEIPARGTGFIIAAEEGAVSRIQIFDPGLCCSTGVCGPEVDEELVRFAADVAWARESGIQVERLNLAQQPLEFANNPLVKAVLQASGDKGLPLTLVDGVIRCGARYPTRAELAEWAGRKPGASLLSIPVVEAQGSACCTPAAGKPTAGGKCCA